MLYRLFKDYVNTGQVEDAIELLSEIIPSLRHEVDPSMQNSQTSQENSSEIILKQALSICTLCVIKERILSEDLQLPYPAGSVAFGKNMGFFVTSVIHQVEIPNTSDAIDCAILYLNSFISYAAWLRTSKRADYHLETISLIGPAISSLMLFQLKANRLIDAGCFPFINEPWFQLEHPNAHKEIMSHLTTFRRRLHINQGRDAKSNPIELRKNTFDNVKDMLKPAKKVIKYFWMSR